MQFLVLVTVHELFLLGAADLGLRRWLVHAICLFMCRSDLHVLDVNIILFAGILLLEVFLRVRVG